MNKTNFIGISLLILNFLDFATTTINLSLGGFEINPLFHYFNTTGIDWKIILFKITFPLILWIALSYGENHTKTTSDKIWMNRAKNFMFIIIGVMLYTVINNTFLLIQLI